MEKPQPPDRSCAPPLLLLHINDNTDDQVLFQAAARRAKVPIECHVVESVERARSYLKSLLDLGRRHPIRPLDLVLLDVILHDGSGLTILKYIRETPELRRVPVVILTGHTNPDLLKEAYALGANAFHEKPVNFEDTVNLVSSLYDYWSSAVPPGPN